MTPNPPSTPCLAHQGRAAWSPSRQGLALVLGALLLASGCAAPHGGSGPRHFDAGFIASRDHDIEGNPRLRVLGPVFEHRTQADGGSFTAIRPFYARSGNPERERVLSEFLWPVGMHKTLGKETYWRFLLTYANDFDNTTPGSRYRFVIFPFVFAGRDQQGERYFAVFPLGGRVHEYLGQDRMVFVLFPLYGYSAINDKTRHSVLWPLIGWGGSPNSSYVGFLPFYARNVKEGHWEKRTIAWPFWTEARYDYPGAEGRVHMLWPLYWRGNLDHEKTWMVLPPFFRYSRTDTLVKAHSPWPILQYRRGGGTDKLYVWPLWGHKDTRGVESWFLFWPIVSGGTRPHRGGTARHFNVTPLLHTQTLTQPQTEEDKADETVVARSVKIWPLFSWRRHEDVSRFRTLEIWPGRNLPQLERNWAPFWTLYTRERIGSKTEDEALWGLFRYRRDDDHTLTLSLFPLFHYSRPPESETRRSWSALLGLIGHERGPTHHTLRLLYIPIRYRAGGEE